jgi:DNA-binding XRE family transcriptional regulator/phage-related protein
MDDKPKFRIIYTSTVVDFLNSIDKKAAAKIEFNINKSCRAIDKEVFEKLIGTDIWEFRTLYKKIKYRVLAFWDTDGESLVIATHGFIKKSAKTPQKEIERAENIRTEYYKQKKDKMMETVKFYTEEEALEMTLGPKGTEARDDYERQMQSFLVGEAIKRTRKSQNLTQEELAKKLGIQRAQVSKIENGNNLTISTISRVFSALGVNVSLNVPGVGNISL